MLTRQKAKGNGLGETEILIESMQKLIDHMSDNRHQEEIFETMTVDDILKIIKNLDDNNLNLRKTTAAFLCQLLYENAGVQMRFCRTLNIFFSEGKVCVNSIPQNFQINAKAIPEILQTIKTSEPPNYPALCWYYEMPKDKNYRHGLKYMKIEQFNDLQARQKVQKFFDPKKFLFGFFVNNQQQIQQQPTQDVKQEVSSIMMRNFSPLISNGNTNTKTQSIKSQKKSVISESEFFSFKHNQDDLKQGLRSVPIKGKVGIPTHSMSPSPNPHNKQLGKSVNISIDFGAVKSQERVIRNSFVSKQLVENPFHPIEETHKNTIRTNGQPVNKAPNKTRVIIIKK